MNLFDVYSLYPVEPVLGKGAYVYDKDNKQYLDFYGGHAVISVGHSHPHYVGKIKDQIEKIGFYSNAVINSLQQSLADKLEQVAGIKDYALFYCNSGAEANENALKMASFHNGKTRVLALENSFHGRTSAAVRVTHNFAIQAAINQGTEVTFLPINDHKAFQKELEKGDVTAVIIEAVQGIGGCHTCDTVFLKSISQLCKENNAILILDEVQCGYGRTGKFFAFQHAGIHPDIITIAKGMGNGFPIAGVLINENVFEARKGMLGTTFGGSHLACAAGMAVLEIIEIEELMENAANKGSYFEEKLQNSIPEDIQLLGKGLMIGIRFPYDTAPIRKKLLFDHHIFSGSSGDATIMRILPPLNITTAQIDEFVKALTDVVLTVKGTSKKSIHI